jgi:eukaryotic-like serine/threonine-protein kinase
MSVACPKCHSALNVKGLKPGQFKPKCPKCGTTFVLVVPEDIDGTILAKMLPEKPAAKAAPTAAEAGPDVTGAFTEVEKPERSEVYEPSSAASPDATGAFTEVDRGSPDRTGAFDASGEQGPDSTGAFTEVNRAVDKTGAFAASGVDDDEAPGGTQQFEPSEPPAPKKKAEKKSADLANIPDKLGGYEVIKVLGKGGMGAVLLGRQVSLDRKVAIKIMHKNLSQNPGFVARFTREAYAAAQLTHHNVVQIYDIGEEKGTHFFSMEFVAGQSLMDLVKDKGKLDPEVAVGYILQAARGLRYGHNQGMVHRDIKPDNLMLNTDGIVKVADLGLVKLPSSEVPQPKDAEADVDTEIDEEDDGGRLTRAGVVMGTPSYMPPEQAIDSAKVDQRADIYSLGCSLYVMLTGKPPFQGKTALEVMTRHQTDPVVPPEVIVKRVPKALSVILLKMLAKTPDDRYQNMDEVIAALEGYLGVKQSGPFTPKEEHAEQLEKATQKFNAASKRGLKKMAGLGFLAVCLLGIIACGLAGAYAWAGGFLGLLLATPVAYFVVSGVYSKSVVFAKVRQHIFGSRIVDWLQWSFGALLFLLTLWIFGIIWHFLGFAILGVGLAFVLWFLTDRAQDAAREEPLNDAKVLFKSMRLQGLDEENLRQFVCKYAGDDWEELYESLFGYEAKIAARAYRKGAIAETSRTFATWREPVIAGIDARARARQDARERRHLEKVQSKALEAKGVSASEAQDQAAALADALVDGANEVKAAEKAGKKVDLRAVVRAAKAKKPPEGYNIAGVKRRSQRMKHLLNDWGGRRLRFLVGAAVFAVGLLWLNQNRDVLKGLAAVVEKAAEKGTLDAAGEAGKTAGKAVGVMRPLTLAVLPDSVTKGVSHYGTPICGFLLMLTGLAWHGWKPSLVAIPGVVIGSMGPMLGIPDADPIKSWMLSTLIGAGLILGVSRFLRS